MLGAEGRPDRLPKGGTSKKLRPAAAVSYRCATERPCDFPHTSSLAHVGIYIAEWLHVGSITNKYYQF